jgi:hypothetical protein
MNFVTQFGIRSFSSSSVLYQEVEYLINGKRETRSSVLAMDPMVRTVAHWSVIVDWDLQRLRNFVIVDPLDPSGLLYLNHAEYLAQSKVCASNDLPLIVIARPGTKGPSPSDSSQSSQNSPFRENIFESKWTRSDRATWSYFLNLRKQVRKVVTLKKGSKMVTETNDTIARTMYVWINQLLHYTEVKNPGIYLEYFIPLVNHLKVILTNNGQAAAVTFLKVSLFALYSFVSGNPLRSTMPLGWGVRLSNGLPSCLSADLRGLLRRDSLPFIRLVASVFNIYRAMDAPHPDPSYSTITKPHPDIKETPLFKEFSQFCQEIFPAALLKETKLGPKGLDFKYKSGLGLLVRSAGANISGPAMGSIVLDAHAWMNQDRCYILDWFDMHGDTKAKNLFSAIALESHFARINPETGHYEEVTKDMLGPQGWQFGLPWMATRVPKGTIVSEVNNSPVPILGRLHTIEEAAGKVRIVAIADYWTQVAMKPIHDHLFRLLSKLASNDATFDQQGVVDSYYKKGFKPHWSFDLKAATDSIPLLLYKEVLGPLLKASDNPNNENGRERAELWASILTDRDWKLPGSPETVRYNTGQPMGALSSWASMAMVHHALVQFAAYRASHEEHQRSTIAAVTSESGRVGSSNRPKPGFKWFSTYLVLGDDIDISISGAVAKQYQDICEQFSIIIGLAKSLQSDFNCFEFANQRFHPKGNISPLSLKEEIASTTWVDRWEYAKRILARFGTSLKDVNSALLRKAATPVQWRQMVPEMSGQRPPLLLNLIRYCLLNPFAREELKDLRIGQLIDWLALILPKEEKSKLLDLKFSASQPEPNFPPVSEAEVVTQLIAHLSREVVDYLRKLEAKCPKPFSWKVSEPESDRTSVLKPFLEDMFPQPSQFPQSVPKFIPDDDFVLKSFEDEPGLRYVEHTERSPTPKNPPGWEREQALFERELEGKTPLARGSDPNTLMPGDPWPMMGPGSHSIKKLVEQADDPIARLNKKEATMWHSRLTKLLVEGYENQFAYPTIRAMTFTAPSAMFASYYLMECFNEHNRKALERITALRRTAELYKYDEEVSNVDFNFEPPEDAQPELETKMPWGVINPLGFWLNLYSLAHSASEYIDYDFSKSIHANLDYNGEESKDSKLNRPGSRGPGGLKVKSVVRKPESIYGPMRSTVLAIAKTLGITIPGLPFFSDGRQGGHWIRNLQKALAQFKAEQARNSSPLEIDQTSTKVGGLGQETTGTQSFTLVGDPY